MASFLSPEEQLIPWNEELKKELEEEKKKSKEKKKDEPAVQLPQPEPFENIFVPRSEWGAGPHAEGHTYLEKPIIWVRFWKYTDTKSCTDKETCKKIVKEIQERHKENGFGDITHNFLLGGDGNVYEGRGWDYKAPKDTRYKHDHMRYMDVAFIGDERNSEPFYTAAFKLLDIGFHQKLIDEDYFQVEWGQEPRDMTMKWLTQNIQAMSGGKGQES